MYNQKKIYKRPPGLFITDFDRTLLRNDKTLGYKDLKAMKRLGRQGILRAVATGRSLYSFERTVDTLGFAGPENFLPLDYVIFSTGAGIIRYPDGTLIKKASLKPDETAYITNYFENNGLDYMIHKSIPYTKYFVFRFHGNPNPDFMARIKLYNKFCSPLNNNNSDNFGSATEVLSIIPKSRALGIEKKVRKALSCFSVIKATSPLDNESLWIEVFPSQVSKSKAGLWLARRFKISREHIVSIGNDYNDMDLLKCSGKSFVVDNAPDDLKIKFKTVSSNNENGVAQAISRGFT